MQPINELKKYAFTRRLTNLEQIRKDYVHDLILFLLYKQSPKFVFKGGTCLWKLHKLPRFSGDLDLSLPVRISFLNNVIQNIKLLGFSTEILKEKTTTNTLFSNIRLMAPSFGSTTIPVQVSFRDENWEEHEFLSPYPDIPDFKIKASPLAEIAKNKVNAILSRNKPRDVFDLYFLTKRHHCEYSTSNQIAFEKAIESKRILWKSLAPLIIGKLPEFNLVKETLLRSVKQQ